MPFTPFHMGPGILVKAVLQGSFSLMVFGWTQIVMDLQPLVVILTGEGHLHGFTHTYVGATLIALFSAVTGKYASEWALSRFELAQGPEAHVGWWIAVLSAFIGSYSHVVLDSIMHSDMEPLYPFSAEKALLGWVSASTLHSICIYSGLVGVLIYFVVWTFIRRK
jgi:membrane-bound metal-dependent hydrolase YbcI (DUF457 family)